MPFTSTQLRRIANVRGQAYIARAKGNRALRVAETYIRRKLYAFEDRAVNREYAILRKAYSGLQVAALNSGSTVDQAWRRRFLLALEPRIRELSHEVAANGIAAMHSAYRMGYLGRLWVLESAVQSVRVNKPRPYNQPIDEGWWLEQYETEGEQGIIHFRRLLNMAVSEQMSVGETMRRVGGELGISRNAVKGLFWRYQTLTRTGIMQASNIGAYDAYVAQVKPYREAVEGPDWLLGMMWLSARDRRVCPICSRLDGQIWWANDLAGLLLTGLPPRGSHHNCRCTVIPILLPDIRKGENEPPDQSYEDWLLYNGYEMGDEFGGLGLDSTQIGDEVY